MGERTLKQVLEGHGLTIIPTSHSSGRTVWFTLYHGEHVSSQAVTLSELWMYVHALESALVSLEDPAA